nr:hypothetical protein GCM10025699_76670 [Microbacterium flavescens]
MRQSFVSELVPPGHLTNAVSLNSASFNGARLIGPAVAGVLIATIGTGWVFLINAGSFAAVLLSLRFIRVAQLQLKPAVSRAKGQIREGFRYVRERPDLVVVFVMVFVIGTFGLNFAIFTSTMASVEFGTDASGFGLLSSCIAVGSLVGALLSARREQPRWRVLVAAAFAFGVTCLVSALMPSYWSFAAVLVTVGLSSITLMTTANATVQLTTAPRMRGRVMALYMAVFTGGTPSGLRWSAGWRTSPGRAGRSGSRPPRGSSPPASRSSGWCADGISACTGCCPTNPPRRPARCRSWVRGGSTSPCSTTATPPGARPPGHAPRRRPRPPRPPP